MTEKKNRNVLLLISGIIGIAYMIYSAVYWSGVNSGSGDALEAIGAGIATALVMPHLVCAAIAVVFNILAWVMCNRSFALVAGILYTVALVLFFAYFMFVIVEMILCFVAFAKMKKAPAKAE